MAEGRLAVIDPRFPLVANQGYVPAPCTVDAPRSTSPAAPWSRGSFQRGDTAYLVDALERLGPTFVGVVELGRATDEEILELVAAVAPRALAENARAWYRPRA